MTMNQVQENAGLVAANRATIARATSRLADAKRGAIAAMASRQPVEALLVANVLLVDDPEVAAVRALDQAARQEVIAARSELSAARQNTASLERCLADAKTAAVRARGREWLERCAPELIVELTEARAHLRECERAEWPAAPGAVTRSARTKVDRLEAEVDRRLAEAPAAEVLAETSARGKR